MDKLVEMNRIVLRGAAIAPAVLLAGTAAQAQEFPIKGEKK